MQRSKIPTKLVGAKKRESNEYLQAHKNEYSDPKKDTWMFKNGK